jgi:signal transduction histidine kinase
VATRWRRWSRGVRPVLTVGCLTAFGIVAEWQSNRFRGDAWLPDLAVGIGLAVSGALTRTVDRRSRLGDLVVLAAVAWFVPNFNTVGISWLAMLASRCAVLHRAVLVHAIVAFPSGRIRSPVDAAVVALAYATVIIGASTSEAAAIVGAVAALGAFVAAVLLRKGPARTAGMRVLPTMALLSIVIGGTGTALLIAGNPPAPLIIVGGYGAGLVAVSFVLLFNVSEFRARQDRVTDAAVELTQGPAGYVRELLATALHDPEVEVAFAIDDGGSTLWVDEFGHHIEPLQANGSRVVIPIRVDGRPVAQLACDSAIVEEPALMRSIEAAARLAASNAQLRASLRAEAAALQASRLRLLTAADDERIALAGRLDRGAGNSLAAIGVMLDRIEPGGDAAIDAAVRLSRSRAAGLDAGLRSLSAGLGPPALTTDGLAAALTQMSSDARVTVRVDVRVEDLPESLASTVYFVCTEAIANALKHAAASTIAVEIHTYGDRLRIEIADDGRGGAGLDHGSGLQGLMDRASALGGTLSVTSPPGAGTRITADLPIG